MKADNGIVPAERTILVVDDEEDILSVLRLIFAAEGFRAECCTSGYEALAALAGGLRPALVLLDLMMPAMNGWEFRAAMLALPALRRIPVVIISGAGADLGAVCRDLTAVGYLAKPFDLSQLLSLVRSTAAETDCVPPSRD